MVAQGILMENVQAITAVTEGSLNLRSNKIETGAPTGVGGEEQWRPQFFDHHLHTADRGQA
jgi:hypothetical protein